MFELYSRRNRKTNDEPDIYEYIKFNEYIRTQLFYIVMDAIKNTPGYSSVFNYLYKFLLLEFGTFTLSNDGTYPENDDYYNFWFKSTSTKFIDLLDSSIYFLCNSNLYIQNSYPNYPSIQKMKEDINFRLKQSNIGYEVIDDKLIRIDNKLLHSKVVKPTLLFLYQKEFKGTEDEIYHAFDYLKDGDYKNTVLFAAKAFESMMKTICSHKQYKYNKDKDTAKELIKILIDNKYIPAYMENHLHSVRATLESGLPTLRNRTGGHGQGDEIIEIPVSFANYALNLTCTNILFLSSLFQT